eukprot:13825644-Alexandrium_andersonii.AAC.1
MRSTKRSGAPESLQGSGDSSGLMQLMQQMMTAWSSSMSGAQRDDPRIQILGPNPLALPAPPRA